MLESHKKLWQKIETTEKKYDYQFKIVSNATKKLLEPPEKPKHIRLHSVFGPE